MGDQYYYDCVAAELQQKFLRPGLWARAVAETGSEGEKARALYIKLRVQELQIENEARAAQEALTTVVKTEAERQKVVNLQKEFEQRVKSGEWVECPHCGRSMLPFRKGSLFGSSKYVCRCCGQDLVRLKL